MTSEPRITVQIDAEAGAAYVRLGRGQVARTVEFNDEIFVDLDEFDVALGIELLDLDTSLPLDRFAERFHIDTATLGLLVAAIRWAPKTTVSSGNATPEPAYGTLVAGKDEVVLTLVPST